MTAFLLHSDKSPHMLFVHGGFFGVNISRSYMCSFHLQNGKSSQKSQVLRWREPIQLPRGGHHLLHSRLHSTGRWVGLCWPIQGEWYISNQQQGRCVFLVSSLFNLSINVWIRGRRYPRRVGTAVPDFLGNVASHFHGINNSGLRAATCKLLILSGSSIASMAIFGFTTCTA